MTPGIPMTLRQVVGPVAGNKHLVTNAYVRTLMRDRVWKAMRADARNCWANPRKAVASRYRAVDPGVEQALHLHTRSIHRFVGLGL